MSAFRMLGLVLLARFTCLALCLAASLVLGLGVFSMLAVMVAGGCVVDMLLHPVSAKVLGGK